MSKDKNSNDGKEFENVESNSDNDNSEDQRITQFEKQALTSAPPPKKVGAGSSKAPTTQTTTTDTSFADTTNLIEKASSIKNSIQNLQVDEIEQIYFNRKVNPLLIIMTQLSSIAVNTSTTAQVYQNNAYGERHDLKKALELSEKVIDECDDLWKIVKYRIDFFFSNINPYE